LIRYSYGTHNLDLPTPAPSPPTWMLTEAQCKAVVEKKGLRGCRDLEYNWLGTDDQGVTLSRASSMAFVSRFCLASR
jgi:microcin C transport system permease protein